MAQQPGPFILQPESVLSVKPEVYDFAADAQKLQHDLEGISAGWNPFMLDLELLAAEPIEQLMVFDFDALADEVTTQGVLSSLPYLDDVEASYAEASSRLDDAIAFAPAQAWADPGAVYELPDSALVLKVPSIDTDEFKLAQNNTVGQNTGGKNPAVGLFNITRYGAVSFIVTDEWEVVALGKEGDVVAVRSKLNGEVLPDVVYDPMDSSGQFFLKGTMGPENVGAWQQDWYVNGQLLGSFNFVVAPSDV